MLLPLLVVLLLVQPATAETRIALVIGISAYRHAPALPNPVKDAQAIGDALRRLNFEVKELHNPDFRTLAEGVREFGIRAQSADTAVVYYAGHGMQVDHENYLIPADARLERTRDLAYEALPLELMLEEVAQAHRIGIVMLDSCRNNPFTERVLRSAGSSSSAVSTHSGLARIDNVPRNTLVAMAAKADQIADDGPDHSPFAAAVLAHLQIPGLELGLFFRSVRDTVLKATQNRQEPFVFSSLGSEPFYFYQRPPNHPPVIRPIPILEVAEDAGPTPLGIPRPTDPDQDPLTVRIIGLPRGGEVWVEGRRAGLNDAFSLDHFMAGTFRPDGKLYGPIGSLDILVEDGRGGSATGSLPIVVRRTRPLVADVPPPSPSPPAKAPEPKVAIASPPKPPPRSALEGVRAAAMEVPCSLLDVSDTGVPDGTDYILVSGPALPGSALDAFLQRFGASGLRVGVSTQRLDRGLCPPLTAVADLVRQTRNRNALTLVVPDVPVPAGGSLMATVRNVPPGALYMDLYAADGSVQHLRRNVVPDTKGGTDVPVTAIVSGPPGPRLLVVISVPAALNLAQRPAQESMAAYLPALWREMDNVVAGDPPPRAEVATLSVIAGAPPSPPSPPREPAVRPQPHVAGRNDARCAAIIERVQLGEGLSSADREVLQTVCGR
ncbi:MAG TPA: caspase family protein [Rhodopila sp.]|nr:caspase family protein [Rhodopila sp.]